MTIDSEIQGVPQSFADFLQVRGYVYDALTQVDMLACALGSQFLLFAGPSGTGKSTAAQVLADFLAPSSRHLVIDARRSWTSSEDAAGQYSAFAKEYIKGPATDGLLQLAGVAAEPAVVIVEEANLSPMDGYLGPVITATSKVAFSALTWPLHRQPAAVGTTPPEVTIKPFPRIFGTINVDSTADAPAPKVSGRSCVVLLEPPTVDAALASTNAIIAAPPTLGATPPGGKLFRDPSAAWASFATLGDTDRFSTALHPLLTVIADQAGGKLNLVSPRDVQRCVLYMAWHVPLAEDAAATGLLTSGHNDTQSAENALLHFVLPGLSSQQFGKVSEPLLKVATPDGLLARRLTKLSAGGEATFGVSPDFWASLS